jgi:hypothetical protein
MGRSMTTQFQKLTKSHRYELVHGDDADFIAYQRRLGDGVAHPKDYCDDLAAPAGIAQSIPAGDTTLLCMGLFSIF